MSEGTYNMALLELMNEARSLDTTPERLTELASDAGRSHSYVALANPMVPFETRFLHEVKTYLIHPRVKVESFYCVMERPEDFGRFLKAYNVTVEDINIMPREWLIGLLKHNG